MFNPRWIVGKRVAQVNMNTLAGERNSTSPSHRPVITFDDGSAISFETEETNDGAYYGTSISYHKKGFSR
jgi:hypothetical protein